MHLTGQRSTRYPRRAELGRRLAFVLSALCMALALLTRYAGSALIAAAGLVLLLDRSQTGLVRIKQAACMACCALYAMLLWMVRNLLVAGSATNRVLEHHPDRRLRLGPAVETMGGWVFPLQTALRSARASWRWPGGRGWSFLACTLQRTQRARTAGSQPAQANPSYSPPAAFVPAVVLRRLRPDLPLFVVFSRLAFDRLITIFEERIAFPLFLTPCCCWSSRPGPCCCSAAPPACTWPWAPPW
jgi:4-amino-4-deoxy-L-arabinose transferase-like glycosyltransferase